MSLLFAATQSKFYNTINEIDDGTAESRRRIQQCRDRQKYYEFMLMSVLIFAFIIIAVLAIIILSILLSILCVAMNTCIEYVIVSLFGRAVYQKNFPVCTNTVYIGNNCYATTSTYCT